MYNIALLDNLRMKMIDWERGFPKRIHHLLKVNSFCSAIAKGEGVDEHTLFIVEALGYIHDIGSKVADEIDGSHTGKTQEKYGEPAARQMLTELGFEAADVDRISMIVGKHHTYNAPIPEIDFRILLEADACVNVYEKDESDRAKRNIYKNIFRTETGKKIYTTMFDLKMDI